MVTGKCGCEFSEQMNHMFCRNCCGLLSACGFRLWKVACLCRFWDKPTAHKHRPVNHRYNRVFPCRVMKNIHLAHKPLHDLGFGNLHVYNLNENLVQHLCTTLGKLMYRVLIICECIHVFLPFLHKVDNCLIIIIIHFISQRCRSYFTID